MLTEIEQLVEATIALIMAIAALPQFEAWLTLVESIFNPPAPGGSGTSPAPTQTSAPVQGSSSAANAPLSQTRSIAP